MTITTGKYLKQLRVRAGLSQLEVAKSLGYASAQFISDQERGKFKVPVDKIGKLAKLYGVRAKDLLYNCHPDIRELLKS